MPEAPVIENVIYDSDAPLVDREQLDMLLMLDEDDNSSALVKELYVLYRTEAIEKLVELERICRECDAAALKKLVHFIAGSAGNLGLIRISVFCRGIEQAIRDGVLEDYEACAKWIPHEFELSCRALEDFLGSE